MDRNLRSREHSQVNHTRSELVHKDQTTEISIARDEDAPLFLSNPKQVPVTRL